MTDKQAKQRNLIITGSSSGIGYHCAHAMKERGWRVFATCRKQDDCDRLISEGLESILLDHDDSESIDAALSYILDKTDGRIDALFNNGAYGIPGAVEDMPRGAMQAIFETNLFGVHELTTKVIPHMRKQGYGRIVQNSSVLGFAALRYRGPYNATKFALEGLSDTMRIELAGTGIHVSLIQPGPITSKIRVNSWPHFQKWVDVENSPFKSLYEKRLIPRLSAKESTVDTFELGPEAVQKRLVHALESSRPKIRYPVTTPTYAFAFLKRILPNRLLDRILSSAS